MKTYIKNIKNWLNEDSDLDKAVIDLIIKFKILTLANKRLENRVLELENTQKDRSKKRPGRPPKDS